MKDQLKVWWDYIQSLLDIDGDVWLGALTTVVIARLILVHWGWPHITTAEATVYSFAVGSFAYSNKGPKA